MKNNSKKMYILIFSLILLIGIGYAAITTTLTITGNANVIGDSTNFQNNIYFNSASLISTGLKTEDENAAQPRLNGNTMNFSVPSSSPLRLTGDKIEVTYTIRNDSNYKAIVALPVVESNSSEFLEYFNISHNRTDNLEIESNSTSDNQKLTLTLKKDYIQASVKNLYFKVVINATAMDSTESGSNSELAISTDPKSFAYDDWSVISTAIKDNTYEGVYHVGDTKEIDMGSYGIHSVRIANTTTTSSCSSPTFSQSGCGFVLEFADVLELHSMNSASTTYPYGTNVGGWNFSELRTYLNSSVYNALPSDLREIILNTNVISGYGYNNQNTSGPNGNWLSTDKIYLLDAREVYGSSFATSYNKANNNERQLDFYSSVGTTQTNTKYAIKLFDNAPQFWWLRSAYNHSSFNNTFFYIHSSGEWDYGSSPSLAGISPAFRIG